MNFPARALINTSALRSNIDRLQSLTPARLIPIIKADAYGHGSEIIAEALRGTPMVGVAQLAEALKVKPGFDHVLTWIYGPDADFSAAIQAGLDMSLGAPWAITALADAARVHGSVRVHVEIDTGMARGGFSPDDTESLAHVARLCAEGIFEPVGLWTHLARADDDTDTTARQLAVFHQVAERALQAGYQPLIRHVAATGGLLWHPETHCEAVRPGIGIYGLSPEPAKATSEELGLKPVMTVEADLIAVRRIHPGDGVSYGHTFVAEKEMTVGTVPLGYADGIPRLASNRMWVSVNGTRAPIIGRVCMDQFVVELPEGIQPGQTVTVLGGEGPSADQWAEACHTINYEIVTRLGSRVPRVKIDP